MENNEGCGGAPQSDNDPNFGYNVEMNSQQAPGRKNRPLETRILAGQVISAKLGICTAGLFVMLLIIGIMVYLHLLSKHARIRVRYGTD